MSKAPRTFHGRWVEAVWEAPKDVLTSTEKVVALAHARDADFTTGGNCYPGAARIVRATGLSEKCVIRTRRALEAKGWLTVVGQRGGSLRGGERLATVYQLSIPTGDRQTMDSRSPVIVSPSTGDRESLDRCSTITPPSLTSEVPTADAVGERAEATPQAPPREVVDLHLADARDALGRSTARRIPA